jgi:hypothetical protein
VAAAKVDTVPLEEFGSAPRRARRCRPGRSPLVSSRPTYLLRANPESVLLQARRATLH